MKKTEKEKVIILDYNKNDYFTSLIKDSINELKDIGSSYCFNSEQLQEIKKHFKDLKVNENDGIYYLSLGGVE